MLIVPVICPAFAVVARSLEWEHLPENREDRLSICKLGSIELTEEI